MNASRTRQEAAHATIVGNGMQPYQPNAAIACKACSRLVYRTQTLVWDLNTDTQQAKAWQYPSAKGLNRTIVDDARPAAGRVSPLYKKTPFPSPPCP